MTNLRRDPAEKKDGCGLCVSSRRFYYFVLCFAKKNWGKSLSFFSKKLSDLIIGISLSSVLGVEHQRKLDNANKLCTSALRKSVYIAPYFRSY